MFPMKKLLSFFLLLFSVLSFAQLDREHWFAPMFDGQSNTFGYEQFLHISTNESTAFNANIYNNNTLYRTVSVKKGAPVVISVPRNLIITTDTFDLFKPIPLGLYVKAEKPCFANLRFGVANHTEIITSKGTAGIGSRFYTVVAPNKSLSLYLGFSASFIATEDNTTVTVNNFKKPLDFNGAGSPTSLTFTINKGQSYIIDGRALHTDNSDGFIGATVTADKPVSMSNGNFNGIYVIAPNSGSDILMDQSVPVDKLGNEFVLVKGYGTIGNNMERAIIVATEKNTAIYLNDNTTPSKILANEGDYYFVEEGNYVSRGQNHYNLHIKSDKNIYVYQVLAGVENGSTPYATGGMNYIPPLNCYLPKKIDEISYINYLSDTPHDPPFTTKLNIITEKGATVKVNGTVPDATDGPFDVSNITANQKWVTYSIPGVTGNITVESTKAVTAGIASGNAAFGYGGYFAGFSAIPLIMKISGECLPGVVLAVTEGFESYQWFIKNLDGTYSPAPGNNTAFNYSPSQAGIYAVKIKEGSCPEIQTADYKFYNCDSYTNVNINSCGTETITPTFALSTQAVNPAAVTLVQPPSQATVTILPNGQVNYTASSTASGKDSFKISYCGIGQIPDCETTQYTLFMIERRFDAVLSECPVNGNATYNLTYANVTPDSTLSKTYFRTENGALNNIAADKILNFTNYNTADTTVYVRLTNSMNCVAVAPIQLKSRPVPNWNIAAYKSSLCDENFDGTIPVNLSLVTPKIISNSALFTVKYYLSQNDAIAGNNNFIQNPAAWSYSGNTTVWVRAESQFCPAEIRQIDFKVGTTFPLTVNSTNDDVCDNDLNDSESITLSDYKTFFTNDNTVSVKYFDDLTKAKNNISGEDIAPTQTVYANKIFYLRFTKNGFCDVIGTLNLIFKKPKKSDILRDEKICPESTIDLDAGSGFSYYSWSKGEMGETTQTINVGVGNYWVDLTFNGCVYRQHVAVTAVSLPVITSVEIVGSTVTVNVNEGTPPYRYSIDGGNFQASNIFTNVRGGNHTVRVVSADNCAPVSTQITVIELYNVITPNGDGINDVLDYSGLLKKEELCLQIFDRYGKIVFTGDSGNKFSWDGTSAGKPVPTGSYWYVIKWREPGFPTINQYSGWILVKNR